MFAGVAITDFCLLVENLEAMMEFYGDQMGFTLRRHAPGFADFSTPGVTLALWERTHFVEHVGIDVAPAATSGSISAVELGSLESVDDLHRELVAKGIHFLVAPRWYAWNAYAGYFEDPEHHIWEIYAWGKEGHAGLLNV